MSTLFRWADLPEQFPRPNVGERKLEGSGVELVRLEIKAGTKAPRHTHPHEQFVQVLVGAGMLETEDGRLPFAAGSVFHFPAETWHAAEFDEDTILVETNLKAT